MRHNINIRMENTIKEEATNGKVPLELYIHIPFCIRKCQYCDFLSFSAGDETKEDYVKALIGEIYAMGESYGDNNAENNTENNAAGEPYGTCSPEHHGYYEVVSVFLGGGTPSVLEAGQMIRIMNAVNTCFHLAEDAEVTTEVNPGTLDAGKLKAYKACKINRLSIGLQSADNKELAQLGRIHTFQEFLESFHLARDAGFDNINVDLMSALPGQTMESYEKTLRAVTALVPEHISAYSLIIEEGTPFYERYGREKTASDMVQIPLPDEDSEREMYHFTKRFLKSAGYERYEISNYSKPGKECRHNLGYWVGTEYLGLGLGASSYMEGERFHNEDRLANYMAFNRGDFIKRSHHMEREMLTEKDRMEEFMFLGLRLADGVRTGEFERRFGVAISDIYGRELKKLLEEGLMKGQEGGADGENGGQDEYWRMTEFGTDVSNYVLGKFLL